MPVYTNAFIDAVALFVVIVVVFADRSLALPEDASNRRFTVLLALLIGILLVDIPAWLLDGVPFPGSQTLCFVLDTLFYLGQIFYTFFWLLFSISWVSGSKAPLPHKYWPISIPLLIEIVYILINPFTGWMFSVDANNTYVRGPHYAVNLIPYLIYILASIGVAVYGFITAKEHADRRRGIMLAVFMVLPLFGAALELSSYGVSWLWPFASVSLLMVYLAAQQQQAADQRMEVLRRAERTAELENELTNSRVAIMLSQMQPHFLYNALSSIKALCTRDPELATQASGDFAEFLRSNMDSLTSSKPVSFTTELNHTKRYLSLELIRFSDRLHVEYDIQADAFTMPTLTLQPIVENAVRYGTMKRIEGGTVTISSRETPEAYVVQVSDDGVGFDPSQKKDDGRSHVGISNVRYRLDAMCDGTLTIDSTPGTGTVATITIPKEALCSH